MTAQASIETPAWRIYALVAAVLGVVVAVVVISSLVTAVPTAPVSTHTPAEQTFLRLVGSEYDDDAELAATLSLGHSACDDMASTGDNAGYRLAVGKLMSYQLSPSYSSLMVHSALTSGLCTER